MNKWRITYNAKFTLSFCLLAVLFLLVNIATNGQMNLYTALLPELSLKGIYRMFTYIFSHADFNHLIGNVLYLLLLGPMLEEKYGTKLLILMTFITAIVTGIINALLFNEALIGASGIVFMFIVLSSIVNMKEKEIPLTFLLVVLIFVGGEVVDSFQEDNISQFGHIAGGLIGGLLGFVFNRRPPNNTVVEL